MCAVILWQLLVTAFPSSSPPRIGSPYPGVQLQNTYVVAAGDTVAGISRRFGLTPHMLLQANHITNPNLIYVGQQLEIPSRNRPKWTERLIRRECRKFHLDPNFALALAYNESGFQQNVVSRTGAIGVMQIEPETAVQLSRDLGQVINLARERDNVRTGVYYLSYLVRYYGGNEQSAAAAYYEGQGNLARRGYVGGAAQYVRVVMALRTRFADGQLR